MNDYASYSLHFCRKMGITFSWRWSIIMYFLWQLCCRLKMTLSSYPIWCAQWMDFPTSCSIPCCVWIKDVAKYNLMVEDFNSTECMSDKASWKSAISSKPWNSFHRWWWTARERKNELIQWYDCMDRQSVCSTRLTPQTVSRSSCISKIEQFHKIPCKEFRIAQSVNNPDL